MNKSLVSLKLCAVFVVAALVGCGGEDVGGSPAPGTDVGVVPVGPSASAPSVSQLVLVAGGAGSTTKDGTGAEAAFRAIQSVSAGPDGMIYVADASTIRKVANGGVVTTLAGHATEYGTANGIGSSARFGGPLDGNFKSRLVDTANPPALTIAATADGMVYVSDLLGGAGAIRQVDVSSGMVSTRYAVSAADKMSGPFELAVNDRGQAAFFQAAIPEFGVCCAGFNDRFIRIASSASAVTALPGAETPSSLFRKLAFDSSGRVHVLEWAPEGGSRISRLDGGAWQTVLAPSADSISAAVGGMAIDENNNLYVADSIKHVVWKVSPSGQATVFLGNLVSTSAAGEETAVQLGDIPGRLNRPYAIAVDKKNKRLVVGDIMNGEFVLLSAPL
ncbi:hypothetical protein [Ottowia sp.]|uniref:hypothetical protein n=1 Tax=Ottowia sp. TaxID=1898956 RepID=UPI0025EEB025|nr:hypothetical protein [Ottowia sp.]MBK6616183.1 hypothetical protein [Ottowia sp.]